VQISEETLAPLASPWRFERLTTAFLGLAKPASVVIGFFVILDLRAVTPVGAYIGLVLALLAIAYRVLPKSDHRTFMLYILGFSLFNGLRTFADDTGHPTSFLYAIRIDGLLGTNPSAWLQEHLYKAGNIGLIGWGSVAVYTSYFTVHYLLAVGLWLSRKEHLSQFVGAILATLFIGLIGYYLLPTAPPWLASESGHLEDVVRIAKVERNPLWADAYAQGSHIAGTNDVGAMPSLHTALTLIVALGAWRINRIFGILGFLYLGAMGFSLVFLGEHYVIDVVAGIATGILGWQLTMILQKRSSAVYSPADASKPRRPALPDDDSRQVA
jgi:membrane-associated phospholipid phosphatase